MSFHWDNPSSDEEEEKGLEAIWTKAVQDQEDENDRDKEDGYKPTNNNNGLFAFDVAMGSVTTQSPSVARLPSGFESEDEDEESVDWEDADHGTSHGKSISVDDEAEDGDKKLAANTVHSQTRQLQPVIIHIGSSSKKIAKEDANTKSEKKQRTTARRKYRFQSLPQSMQCLLEQLHKSHWLALTSHVTFHSSRVCSDELVLSLAHSLVPRHFWSSKEDPMGKESADTVQNDCAPSRDELKHFCDFYFDLIHNAESRLRERLRENAAAGAPRLAGNNRGSRRNSRYKRKLRTEPGESSGCMVGDSCRHQPTSTARLLHYCSYLAMSQSEDPQLWQQQNDRTCTWSRSDQISLFIAMTRSLGWRTRYVASIEPMKKDLDMDHPVLMGAMVNVFHVAASWSRSKKRKTTKTKRSSNRNPVESSSGDTEMSLINPFFGGASPVIGWAEVLCRIHSNNTTKARDSSSSKPASSRWIHVDALTKTIDEPTRVEFYLFEELHVHETDNKHKRMSNGALAKRRPTAFIMAAEHHVSTRKNSNNEVLSVRKRVTDVTPRYAISMVETLKLRGIAPQQQAKAMSDHKRTWWSMAVKKLNASFRGVTMAAESASRKTSPLSKKASLSTNKGKTESDAIDIHSDNDERSNGGHADAIDEADEDDFEQQELAASVKSEAIPTSKDKFKNHPLYVIPSVLKATEVLPPDAKKRVKGFFKGEMVFARSEVSEARTEKKWLYQGRKVRESELKDPVKRVKARAKSTKGGNSFKALRSYGVGNENDGSAESEQKQLALASEPLNDGMNNLYAIWQTDSYSLPFVGPTCPIPVNEYKNVELALMNPGLAHIDSTGIAKVAKKLGIPYAPCLLGFEGHGGNRTPAIRGIVVHEHNADLLREASVEVERKSIEDESEKRRRAIYTKWKKLLVGVLTKDRIEREYG